MADTITFNYHWVKPEISGSPTTWGVKLNADLDLLDSTLFAIDQRADSFVGAIMMFGGATAPPKWKLCDGTIYDIADIPQLAPVIGNIYGGVPGISCAVPNVQQKFPIGSQIGLLAAGATGGEATHVLTTAEMPTHTHTPTVTDPGHEHDIQYMLGGGGSGGPWTVGSAGNVYTQNTDSSTADITVAIANTGGGVAHNNLPPYVCINFIIKYML